MNDLPFLLQIAKRKGWRWERVAKSAFASIIALSTNLIGGGAVVQHLVRISDYLVSSVKRHGWRLDGRHSVHWKFVRWMQDNQDLFSEVKGAFWSAKPNPRHALYRIAFSRTSTWAALQYPPPEKPILADLCAVLAAELVVCTWAIASRIRSRKIYERARKPRDFILVAQGDYHLLNTAGRAMRRLLQQPIDEASLNGLSDALKGAKKADSQVAVYREWLRTQKVPLEGKAAGAVLAILTFADHVHGVRRVRDVSRVPRSGAERESYHAARGRGATRNLRIAIARGAESHRAGVTQISRSLMDTNTISGTDIHPDEADAITIEMASAGCESDRHTYRQLRTAKGLRRAVERAGLGLPWNAAELTPSEVLCLHRALRARDPQRPSAETVACIAMDLSLLIGRPIGEVRDARRGIANPDGMVATIELIASGGQSHIRVAVPQPVYQTEMTTMEEAACHPTHRYLDLQDVTGAIAALTTAHGGTLPDLPFELANDDVCESVLDGLTLRYPILARVRLSRLCEPLITKLNFHCSNPARAALITGRSRHCSHVLLHYTTLPAELLTTLYLDVLEEMKLIDPGARMGGTHQSGMVGNPRCPTNKAIESLICGLKKNYLKARQHRRSTIVAVHNAYTRYVGAALMLGLSLRAIRDPVPDIVDIGSRIAVWTDKARDDFERRVAFLTQLLLDLAQDYDRYCLHILADYPLVGADRGSLPFLFLLDERYAAHPLSPGDFPGPGVRYPLDIRSLRRAMQSHLDRSGVPAQIIDAMVGHTSAGRESWSTTSTFVATYMRKVTDHIVADFMQKIGVERVPCPRINSDFRHVNHEPYG